MTRTTILVACAALVWGCAAATGTAAARPPAGPATAACHASGTAVFSEGLGSTAQDVSYRIRGALDTCQSDTGDTTFADATLRGTAVGSQSCDGGSGHGVAHIAWTRKVRSVVRFTTSTTGTALTLDGKIVRGGGRGDPFHAALALQLDPTDCANGQAKSAPFDGTAEYGSSSP